MQSPKLPRLFICTTYKVHVYINYYTVYKPLRVWGSVIHIEWNAKLAITRTLIVICFSRNPWSATVWFLHLQTLTLRFVTQLSILWRSSLYNDDSKTIVFYDKYKRKLRTKIDTHEHIKFYERKSNSTLQILCQSNYLNPETPTLLTRLQYFLLNLD